LHAAADLRLERRVSQAEQLHHDQLLLLLLLTLMSLIATSLRARVDSTWVYK
jgi:hypothetical protein